MKTSKARGNTRLLKLAGILEAIQEGATVRTGEPAYNQYKFAHACNAPACALGYWAYNNPKRWAWPVIVLKNNSRGVTWLDAREEFAISDEEYVNLFGIRGCNNAEDATAAARYIRDFVAERKGEVKSHG